MVDDDDGDGFPSSEPRTDSRSALPRKNRAWRWLRIVKHDESFSLIFSPRKRMYGVAVEVGGDLEGPQGQVARPHPCGQGVGTLWLIISLVFFIYSKTCLRKVSGLLELCRIVL